VIDRTIEPLFPPNNTMRLSPDLRMKRFLALLNAATEETGFRLGMVCHGRVAGAVPVSESLGLADFDIEYDPRDQTYFALGARVRIDAD
jgi:hypothetical protein